MCFSLSEAGYFSRDDDSLNDDGASSDETSRDDITLSFSKIGYVVGAASLIFALVGVISIIVVKCCPCGRTTRDESVKVLHAIQIIPGEYVDVEGNHVVPI